MKNMKAIFRSPTRIRHIKQSYDTIYRCCSTKKVDDVRTFSGIQPTGSIHLGNYLGAVKSWVDGVAMSSKEARDQNLFSIVNLHAITLPQNPSMLDANTYSMAASLIACGLQPDKVYITFIEYNFDTIHSFYTILLSILFQIIKTLFDFSVYYFDSLQFKSTLSYAGY